ncbi:Septal ring factor EnvC, activator of murein hydrolases AmiA and AmiB [Tranquillimonas rosea]|uniref:Septal ring factor EnvC, activator of murein hydrolases AmiA and AmiB n=1 Tax=Tranquillimonas rosea TaxID=641238 RepID=A0A1H9U8L9_9RHOB|nr:peptidoglycan DD-metalloendopeptidase family protein [Tranquillimonas rosea]SES05672.1 Septal ring factor EnvC, activator of murein hydrolases AmiA and AmiB [Tranquillimonas rosea]
MRRLAACLALFIAGPLAAQTDPGAAARRAADALDAAAVELARAEGAQNRVAALTEAIRAYESGLASLREGLRRASLREASIRAVFDAESGRLSQLVGALQTMQTAPEATLLLHPSGPVGTARSGMMMSDVTPALQSEIDRLRGRLEEIAALRRLQEDASEDLEAGLRTLQEARVELSRAVSERTDLPRRVVEDEGTMRNIIAGTETLAGFAEGLSELPADPEAPAIPDFAAAQGDLALPVEGNLLRAFDEADAAGVQRPGWLLATTPGALVTTPWPATVRYRGPLLDYGNVIVLEPTAGYLMVFAGLREVYGETGQVLPAGAPVGLVGDPGRAAIPRDSGDEAGQGRIDTLYIELRQGDTPLDPAEWFRRTED